MAGGMQMSLSYRLGSNSLFTRPNEESKKPKRVVFLSTEGTSTEVCYFKYIERFREQLGIDTIVHVEVLRRYDTNSDPGKVLELLEEFVEFREDKIFESKIDSLNLKKYSTEFIKSYLENPESMSARDRHKFEAVLKEEHIDLLYLDFLNKYRGDNDAFGIVIDRDGGSHTVEQMNSVIEKCRKKNYLCYITNPCFEFWLLLHISDVKTEFAEQLNDILENKVDTQGNSFVSNLLYDKTGHRKSIQCKTFETYYLPNIDAAIERAKFFASEEELVDKIGSNLDQLFTLLRSE